MAAGVIDRPLHHTEVMETAARVETQFTALVKALIPQVAATVS
jgi:purine-nucleoside phosphorylase